MIEHAILKVTINKIHNNRQKNVLLSSYNQILIRDRYS
jgi:hypothetical protein